MIINQLHARNIAPAAAPHGTRWHRAIVPRAHSSRRHRRRSLARSTPRVPPLWFRALTLVPAAVHQLSRSLPTVDERIIGEGATRSIRAIGGRTPGHRAWAFLAFIAGIESSASS